MSRRACAWLQPQQQMRQTGQQQQQASQQPAPAVPARGLGRHEGAATDAKAILLYGCVGCTSGSDEQCVCVCRALVVLSLGQHMRVG
eukprot:6382511-Alexandrium_andersonii.AAC.1